MLISPLNSLFYLQVLRTKQGELRVQRQKGVINPDDYVPCPSCNRWFIRHFLSKHGKKCACKLGLSQDISLKQAIHMRFEKSELSPTSILVLSGLTDGPISSAIKGDSTLIDFVNCRAEVIHDTKDSKKIANLRHNMRLLGRLLNQAQERRPGTSMMSLLLEWDFDELVEVVNLIPVKEGSTGSTRLNLGYQLKAVLKRLEENATDMPDSQSKAALEKKLGYLNTKMQSQWSRQVWLFL